MSSLSEQSDGSFLLVYGDALPLGHELAEIDDAPDATVAERNRARRTVLSALRKNFRELVSSTDPEVMLQVEQMDDRYSEDVLWLSGSEAAISYTTTVTKKLARMTLEQLGDFCEWNVRFADNRQARLDTLRPKLDEAVLEGVDRLYSRGFIDGRVVGLYTSTMQSTEQLSALDCFDAAGMLARGYCLEDGTIGLAQPMEDSFRPGKILPDFIKTTFHEYSHAIGTVHGATYTMGAVDHPLLEEAFVSHISEAAFDPDFDPYTFNPAGHALAQGSYLAERELVAGLMHYGPDDVSVEVLRDGFYGEPPLRSKVLRALLPLLDEAVLELLPGYDDWYDLENSWNIAKHAERPQLLQAALRDLYHYADMEVISKGDAAGSPANVSRQLITE